MGKGKWIFKKHFTETIRNLVLVQDPSEVLESMTLGTRFWLVRLSLLSWKGIKRSSNHHSSKQQKRKERKKKKKTLNP